MSFRVTAVMLAALVLLAAVVWFSEFRDRSGSAAATTPTPDPARPVLFAFDDREVNQFTVTRADREIQVRKNEAGEWGLQPSGQPGDRVRISSVLLRLSSLTATSLVTETPSDLAQYGLQTPSITVSVAMQDGAMHGLEVGARAPGEAGTYVKKPGESAVYVIPNQLASDLERLINEPPIAPTPTPPSPVPSPSPAG